MASITETKKAQILEKLSADEYAKFLPETDTEQVKLTEAVAGHSVGEALIEVIKAIWNKASEAGVSGIKQGTNGTTETGIVTITLEKLGTVAITSDQVTLITTNKNNIATLTSNLTNNTYGFAKKSDITSIFRYKGTVETEANLPTSNNQVGDVYIVTAKSCEHIWDGTKWEEFGPTIDLSKYVTTDTLNALKTELQGNIDDVVSSVTVLTARVTSAESKITNITNGTTVVPNATTATKFKTATKINYAGDVNGALASFDGSQATYSVVLALSNTGVTAGTYSAVQVDSKGRVTKGQQSVVFATGTSDSALNNLCIGGLAFIEA